MLRSAVAIAGVIGLAAISHRHLLRHYLTLSRSQTPKPRSQDKNQNKAGCTEQGAMVFNSDGTDVPQCCISNDRYILEKGGPRIQAQASWCNSNDFDALESRKKVLDDVMETLADPNKHLVGVYGLDDEIKDILLQRVYRRIERGNLFGMVVTTTVSRYPDVRKIQDEIARKLGFAFNNKSRDKRAKELIERIKNKQNILIVLCDLYRELDLSKVGIPCGSDHAGCKILLTSATEHVLSDHMHTEKNFMV
ncbi:probable disease resistance protein At5g47260 [Neltuma alba]|uniref:probable disease resistance protein At5g47260 n=1 Tax=Neltuma alba TaxID=207710 RepID=UPI0010A3014B|nr:probable disease resistance protein At5g47260 [Prosopis alba]